MEKGLGASMWAPTGGMRRAWTYGDGHEGRSRSLPPLEVAAAAGGGGGGGRRRERRGGGGGTTWSTYGSASSGSRSSRASKTTTTTNTTASASASTHPIDAASRARLRLQSFHRFEQTCHRLRWKFIDLQSSYERALRPHEWSFTPEDAERNFKVDFYEFYVWIEQAVVFLLLVFGVSVGRGASAATTRGHWTSSLSLCGDPADAAAAAAAAAGKAGSSHAYHHNVLKALEDKQNPLHGTLGAGDVNQALWKAKELRNRWKDAAEGKETPPLKMYDLRWIVASILGGLEEAYRLAGREVEGDLDVLDVLGRREKNEGVGEQEEDGWEWMVESMDWEP
ncbi:hypothetical protein E4U43_006568 [Claviceps pusilla]|uniref:Uncharacterized protein n=1 Tax=Claviceps pusilla TaxID=123648 RepID=A0A9P7SYK9_9HYPO|nr:hypothetical protein E4U43_006568 [Claviceps pusilla]